MSLSSSGRTNSLQKEEGSVKIMLSIKFSEGMAIIENTLEMD
jgi:hypothetical protein